MTDIEADLNRGVSDTSVADDVIQYVQIRSLYREEKIIQRVRYFEKVVGQFHAHITTISDM